MFLNSVWIPYDVDAVSKFYDYVSKAIGTSTNVGVRIFALIVGIGVVIRIVNMFIDIR